MLIFIILCLGIVCISVGGLMWVGFSFVAERTMEAVHRTPPNFWNNVDEVMNNIYRKVFWSKAIIVFGMLLLYIGSKIVP